MSATVNAGIAGGVSGYVTTGKLSSAVLSAAEAVAFVKVGDAMGTLPNDAGAVLQVEHAADEFAAHGLVGGIFSAAAGGKFGSGFLAAGFGSLAPAPTSGDWGEITEGMAEASILGGAGSILGGGKFANGAITGAFYSAT